MAVHWNENKHNPGSVPARSLRARAVRLWRRTTRNAAYRAGVAERDRLRRDLDRFKADRPD